MPPEGLTGKTANGETLRVREVWDDNLADEIALIRNIVEEYPYVAMDTEFPGVVARPVGHFKSNREYHYRVSTAAAATAAVVCKHAATLALYLQCKIPQLTSHCFAEQAGCC
jgi:hypothetical protein